MKQKYIFFNFFTIIFVPYGLCLLELILQMIKRWKTRKNIEKIYGIVFSPLSNIEIIAPLLFRLTVDSFLAWYEIILRHNWLTLFSSKKCKSTDNMKWKVWEFINFVNNSALSFA